jgi:hypothetical protein
MTPENFVYWLQGFMELGDPSGLDAVQVQTIRDHLELVMEKQTPVRTVTTVTPNTGPGWIRGQTACSVGADPRHIRMC